MSAKFNGIRKFRNRIFHHEAIAWNLAALDNYKHEILEGISWLDRELLDWSNDLFRIEDVLKNEKENIR